MDIYVFINGERKSLVQLAAESGVPYDTLLARWKSGVPADQLVPKKNGGADGFSPSARVVQTDTGATIIITDKTGTTTAEIRNGSGSATPYDIGSGLRLDNNVLSVDTADTVEEDNAKPITSAAVYTEVGNINALLAKI